MCSGLWLLATGLYSTFANVPEIRLPSLFGPHFALMTPPQALRALRVPGTVDMEPRGSALSPSLDSAFTREIRKSRQSAPLEFKAQPDLVFG